MHETAPFYTLGELRHLAVQYDIRKSSKNITDSTETELPAKDSSTMPTMLLPERNKCPLSLILFYKLIQTTHRYLYSSQKTSRCLDCMNKSNSIFIVSFGASHITK